MPCLSLDGIELMLREGKGLESIAMDMTWQDFEGIVSEIFSANGFRTFRNFRFSSKKKRYEIDVVALAPPRVILTDCKHWCIRQGKASSLRAAAVAQSRRAEEFALKMQEFACLGMERWGEVTIVPIIITLYQESIIENRGTFVIPVFKLNSYIEDVRSGMCDENKVKVPRIDAWQYRNGSRS